MRAILLIAMLVVAGGASAQSEEITTCRNPSGRAYYHFNGQVGKADSGWTDDKISNGVVTLMRAADGTLDMLFIDVRGKPVSMTQDGAVVRVLRLAPDQITLLAYYEGATTEIYSFFREKDGTSRYTVLTNKTGEGAIVPKSGVMVGTCDPIRFDALAKR
jgi:hypothetical protein